MALPEKHRFGTLWYHNQSITNDSGTNVEDKCSAGVSAYLGLGATSASDSRAQGAGPAAVLVAQLLTQMDGVWNYTIPLSPDKLLEQCMQTQRNAHHVQTPKIKTLSLRIEKSLMEHGGRKIKTSEYASKYKNLRLNKVFRCGQIKSDIMTFDGFPLNSLPFFKKKTF